MAPDRVNPMPMLSATKLVFLDVETTGLSPAMGDRVVELGMIVCRGATEISRSSYLVHPERPIPIITQRIHGISDLDVADCPPFKSIAQEVGTTLADAWIVGHNIRFDIGFMAMELQRADCVQAPLGCLDTCQLASALWEFPNYKLDTVVEALAIPTTRLHRALEDADVTREIFHRAIQETGSWEALTVHDLLRLHRYEPTWAGDPKADLPTPLYDALTNGGSLSIRYTNGLGQSSSRGIRPETSFASGRHTYVRAFCEKSHEVRTFRLDRIVIEASPNPAHSTSGR